jgi:hypothetical protein
MSDQRHGDEGRPPHRHDNEKHDDKHDDDKHDDQGSGDEAEETLPDLDTLQDLDGPSGGE